MLPSTAQKKNLIEAMKKLTYQISNNPERQKQIFDSLSSNDLIKIIQNLNDDNQYLRRISALLLCELFYNNSKLKLSMINKLSLPVGYGRVFICVIQICLNKIPQGICKNSNDMKKCVEIMKSKLKKGEDKMFCWAINFDKKVVDIEFFEFKKYSSFTFLDPQRTVFGFTIIDSEIQHETPQSPATTQIFENKIKLDLTSKTPRQTSKDSKLGDSSQRRSSITKKYQFLRPSTGTITSKEKSHFNTSKEKQFTYIRQNESSQISKHKLGTSIQSISQYARNSYGRQNTERDKPKQNQRYSISYHDSGFDSSRLNTQRFQTRRSSQLQTSSGKNKVGSKTPNHHQNFYKRVQEILRK